jgi:hypothetical protein
MVCKFVCHMCNLSIEKVIRLLDDGNLQHVPNITHADVFKMYGPLAGMGERKTYQEVSR